MNHLLLSTKTKHSDECKEAGVTGIRWAAGRGLGFASSAHVCPCPESSHLASRAEFPEAR